MNLRIGGVLELPGHEPSRLGGDLLVARQQQLQRTPADLAQDRGLVGEMHIEGGGGEPDLLGDLADGRALIAVGDEDPLGRIQDLAAAQVAGAAGFAGLARASFPLDWASNPL